MSKIVKIASLGKENKSAYDAANQRYFVATRFRDTAVAGAYMLVITSQEFTKRTDESGNQVDCAPWTREEVALVGDFKACVVAKNETAINAGLEAAIIAAESKALAASYSPAAELKAAAVNA